jgi:hypothetical protein
MQGGKEGEKEEEKWERCFFSRMSCMGEGKISCVMSRKRKSYALKTAALSLIIVIKRFSQLSNGSSLFL